MRKTKMFILVFGALFAIGAIAATVASAETTLLAEWLASGAAITTLTSTERTGKVIVGDAKIGLRMECEMAVDGSVGPNGEDETTEYLSSGGVVANLSNHLHCVALTTCSNAEFAPEQLPWLTQSELLENGGFGDIVTLATYWFKCTVLGINTEEECQFNNGLVVVENGPSGVLLKGLITPKGNCSVGGSEAVEVEYVPGTLLKTLTGTLSVSSE